jgi:hypothetical protein
MDTTQFQQLPLICFLVGGWRQQQTWQEHTDGDGCVWDGLIDRWVSGNLAPNQTVFFSQASKKKEGSSSLSWYVMMGNAVA